MTADRQLRAEAWLGCVLGVETGIVRLLTDRGELRAGYGARLLGLIARDRTEVPVVGDWVRLRSWSDDRVTVEGRMGTGGPPLGTQPPVEPPVEPRLAPVVWLSSRR